MNLYWPIQIVLPGNRQAPKKCYIDIWWNFELGIGSMPAAATHLKILSGWLSAKKAVENSRCLAIAGGRTTTNPVR